MTSTNNQNSNQEARPRSMVGNSHNNTNNIDVGAGEWAQAFDRLTRARKAGTPAQELERQARAELARLTRKEN